MNKNLKNYPQSILQLVVIFGAFIIFENLLEKYTKIEELHWSLTMLSKLSLFVVLAVLLNFEKKVRIENSKLIKGNYNGIFGFIKIEKQFTIESITDIIIFQNAKKHFEIKVIALNGEMILDSFVNRNPAVEELERVEKIIKTVANSSL